MPPTPTTVVRQWQLTPQSCNYASELIFILGGGVIQDLPLQKVKFSFHYNSSFLASTEIVTDDNDDDDELFLWYGRPTKGV